MTRAAIIGNRRLRPSPALRRLLRRADLVICADGGVRAARSLGIVPQVVVGDLDSAGAGSLAWARGRRARLIAHPREKDKTDAQLAVEYALRSGAREIDLLGVLGGRLDHTLANIGLLVYAAGWGCRARILHERTELFLAAARTTIRGRAGDLVSLIPLSATATGVTTRGLKYPLHNDRLRMDATRGISNEMSGPAAVVKVGRGWLLVVVTHRR